MSDVGTDLYHRMIEGSKDAAGGAELAHKIWDGTPWMVDAYTGPTGGRRDCEIREWCYENFGPSADPFSGQPGRWWRGLATICGWTWYGFATQADMDAFAAAWGVVGRTAPCSSYST